MFRYSYQCTYQKSNFSSLQMLRFWNDSYNSYGHNISLYQLDKRIAHTKNGKKNTTFSKPNPAGAQKPWNKNVRFILFINYLLMSPDHMFSVIFTSRSRFALNTRQNSIVYFLKYIRQFLLKVIIFIYEFCKHYIYTHKYINTIAIISL